MPAQSFPDTTRLAVLESIAYVAVEFEQALDLPRLANFIDLYARWLESAAGRDAPLDFESFVQDRAALSDAAALAEREAGVPTSAPEPLAAIA